MRFPHVAIGLCLIVALSSLPSPGHAQLGGLVKKAKEKVAPSADPSSTDQPARLAGPELTPGVVDHFLAGLKAEKAAKDRAEAAEKERKKQEAEQQMDPAARHWTCVSEKQQQDPEQATAQQLAKDASDAAQKGDNQKAMDIAMKLGPMTQEIQKRAEAACASVKAAPAAAPTPEQQAVQNASQVPPEAAGAKTAGLTPVEYGQVKELIYTYLNYGNRAGVTDAEKRAIEAKRAELKAAFTGIGM